MKNATATSHGNRRALAGAGGGLSDTGMEMPDELISGGLMRKNILLSEQWLAILPGATKLDAPFTTIAAEAGTTRECAGIRQRAFHRRPAGGNWTALLWQLVALGLRTGHRAAEPRVAQSFRASLGGMTSTFVIAVGGDFLDDHIILGSTVTSCCPLQLFSTWVLRVGSQGTMSETHAFQASLVPCGCH